ncbi:MAG: hypothetical protein WAU86_03405 [Oricola sp.]
MADDLILVRPHASALLFQAPVVMMLRLPLLYADMARAMAGGRVRESERAVVEKIGAHLESAGKLHAELSGLWVKPMFSALTPGALLSHSAKLPEIVLEPYARRVLGNARRLTRRDDR